MSADRAFTASAVHEVLRTQLLNASLYYGHGADNASDEAYACLCHVLNWLPGSPLTAQVITAAEHQALQVLVQQRIQTRKPLAYLLQKTSFAGLEFYIDERVIVPRSPMAELIQQGLQPWLGNRPVNTLLDLATGSGCLAIAAAYAFPEARIDATDLSSEALEVAAINVVRHQLQTRVHLHQADLFKGLAFTRYDVILTNPPYVSAEEIKTLAPEYHHEPNQALEGGDQDGLHLVTQLINTAADFLSEQGILFLEVGDREQALMQRFPGLPIMWHEFSNGGQGVAVLEASELKAHLHARQ